MFAPPNWFLYSSYTPADTAKFLSVVSIAYAIGLGQRSVATTLAQHGRVGRWICQRTTDDRKPAN